MEEKMLEIIEKIPDEIEIYDDNKNRPNRITNSLKISLDIQLRTLDSKSEKVLIALFQKNINRIYHNCYVIHRVLGAQLSGLFEKVDSLTILNSILKESPKIS